MTIFIKTLGKASSKEGKKLAANVFTTPKKTLEIVAKLGTATVPGSL